MNYFSNLIFGNPSDGVEASSNGSATNADRRGPPTLLEVPKLVDDVVKLEGEEGTIAARRLYELTDVAHKNNRIPMLTSGNYNVLAALTECLTHLDNDEKLHFTCLTLNNLSIPDPNKRIMAMERGSKTLIGNLSQVIKSGKKETYLCCIILMNMSFLEPSIQSILQYAPPQPLQLLRPRANSATSDNPTTATSPTSSSTTNSSSPAKTITSTLFKTKVSPLEDPNSLLRILQDLLAHAARGTLDFRWAFGLLSSLSRDPENAVLIAQTAIPKVAVENIRLALLDYNQQQQQQDEAKGPSKNLGTRVSVAPSQWQTNSLEDFSLFVILHIAQVSTDALHQVHALDVIAPIMMEGDGYIQNLKATMICAFLEAPWNTFPQYGIPAAASVSELMGNTFDQKGKTGVYSNNIFKLRTATKAYADLCRLAAKADEEEMEINKKAWKEDSTTSVPVSSSPQLYRHSKVVALPTAVAMLFQIVAEVALSSMSLVHDQHDAIDDDYQIDEVAATHAVRAIMALLPALLQAEYPPRQSRQTEIACHHLTHLLFSYSKKKSTPVPAKARAKEAAERFDESASKSALPLLEASYDLWVQFNS